MRYEPEAPLPSTNVVREKKLVKISNMRNHEESYQLHKNGFKISKLATNMTYQDYDSHKMITDVYLNELEGVLCNLFPRSEVDFVTYLVGLTR